MQAYSPNEYDLIVVIKRQMERFIENSGNINQATKRCLIEELERKWDKNVFDLKPFIRTAVEYSVYEWKERNIQIEQLWKQVAIENAKINNEPFEVANNTIESYEKQFTL